MGLFDNLGGLLGQAGASALPSLLEKVVPGGLQGVLNQLQQSGYGEQVSSWLGRGPNQPITVDDLRAGLDNEQVRAVAEKLGVPLDEVLKLLAGNLPQAVDEHSPDGQLRQT